MEIKIKQCPVKTAGSRSKTTFDWDMSRKSIKPPFHDKCGGKNYPPWLCYPANSKNVYNPGSGRT